MTNTTFLSGLRRELRELLADLETVDRPAPTRRTPTGPVWEINETLPRPRTWRVRAHTGEQGLIDWQLPESAQLSTALLPGDWAPLSILDARRLAAAILAACDHAETSGATADRPRNHPLP